MNRLLKWALGELAHLVVSARLSRALSEAFARLVDISALAPPISVADRLALSPRDMDLEPGLRVARLLLRRRTMLHANAADTLPGFLWKSSSVFEDFVRYLMRRVVTKLANASLTKERLILAQRSGHSHAQDLTTTPDFKVGSAGTTLIIADAKYKLWRGVVPSETDVYQVMAGGRAANCTSLALIYPREGEQLPDSSAWETRHQPKTKLTAIFLEMDQVADHHGVRNLVDQLALAIRSAM